MRTQNHDIAASRLVEQPLGHCHLDTASLLPLRHAGKVYNVDENTSERHVLLVTYLATLLLALLGKRLG